MRSKVDNNMNRALDIINSADRIVVITGAGISTVSGLSDFRGPKGLYRMAEEKYKLPYPEALFDISYFRRDPHPFFDLSKNMFLQDAVPSLCHKMIARLEERGKVSYLMTQNIDMLHQKAGSRKILECHGSYESAHCLGCRKAYLLKDIKEDIMADRIPRCACGGVIKPDVVFFGENLPEEFYRVLDNPPGADLVLILGTSLNVQPASLFALNLVSRVPSVLVNLEETPYDSEIDVIVHEDLEIFAGEIMGITK